MEKNNIFSTKVIIAFIVGVAIGFGGTWFSLRAPAGDTDADDEAPNTSSGIVLADQNVIHVRDQQAGEKVSVELVTLENTGWVVIHEDEGGALGNALGAQLFDSGSNTGAVDLLRNTEGGKAYHAVLRQDDGDRAFDLSKDLILSDAEGNPVQTDFKTN